jgi:hypothetical protein
MMGDVILEFGFELNALMETWNAKAAEIILMGN